MLSDFQRKNAELLDKLLFDLRSKCGFSFAYFPDGNEGEGDEGSGEADASGTDSDEGDNDDGSADDDTKKPKQKINDPEKKKLSDEAARYRKEKRDLERKLKELEDKDKTESDKLKETADLVPRLTETNNKLLIENAFLKACDKYEVKDRETVFLLAANDKTVKVDDDGDVVGVEEALEKIKTSKPFLFGKDEDTDNQKNKNASGGHGSSGSANNSKKETGIDQDALRKKYPALRR